MWQWTEKDKPLNSKELKAVDNFLSYDIVCGKTYTKGDEKRKVIFIRYPYGTISKDTRTEVIGGIVNYRTMYAFPDVKEITLAYKVDGEKGVKSVTAVEWVAWFDGGVKVSSEKVVKESSYVKAKKDAIAKGSVETKPFKKTEEQKKKDSNWKSPVKKKKS